MVNQLVYDALGNVTRMGSRRREPAVDSLFLFTARPFDADTGLQNNLHRWYDPAVGRWLSEDPVGFNAGDENLYRYVGNAPLVLADPRGTVRLPGAVSIYPSPSGSFDVSLHVVQVSDPKQQAVLGQTAIGYEVTYRPPAGVCQQANETIHMVQALYSHGWLTGTSPEFDAGDTPPNLFWPPYPGQSGSAPNSIVDRPYNPWKAFTSAHRWEITVCAVCTTCLYHLQSGIAVTVQQVLGCINFQWVDSHPPVLVFAGQEYHNGDVISSIPATSPGNAWDAAMENL